LHVNNIEQNIGTTIVSYSFFNKKWKGGTERN
jgi:hypothetical protein